MLEIYNWELIARILILEVNNWKLNAGNGGECLERARKKGWNGLDKAGKGCQELKRAGTGWRGLVMAGNGQKSVEMA